MGVKKPRRQGLLALVIAFLLAVNATLGVLLTRQSGAALISLIQQRMLDISNTAAAMLDGDSLARLTAADADTPEYQKVMETLTYFQDNIELKYIYCVTEAEDGSFVFSVDPTVADPGEFGTPVVYTDALYRASRGTPAVDARPYHDAWGTFYSAYSPVFTSTGEVAGIVAVDFAADWYDRQVAQLIRTVILVGVVSLLVGVLIVTALTRRNRRRYRVLSGQLNELAEKVRELTREVDRRPGKAQEVPLPAEEPWEGEDMDSLGAKILAMQDELRGHIERVRQQAYEDGLTGVGNKAAYLDTVQTLEEAIRSGSASLAVGVFDLNELKTINDCHGHEYGDLALMDAAEVLGKVFGQEALYRIGGDEFAVLLSPASGEEMDRLFRRLDQEVLTLNQEGRPYEIPLAISKGAAVYSPDLDPDFAAVFRRADLAMYEDKKTYYSRSRDRRRS